MAKGTKSMFLDLLYSFVTRRYDKAWEGRFLWESWLDDSPMRIDQVAALVERVSKLTADGISFEAVYAQLGDREAMRRFDEPLPGAEG